MFDLEKSIADWRRQMLSAGLKSPAPLEELESHLRQDIAALVLAGNTEAEAFEIAAARLGNPAAVGLEFNKIKNEQILSVKIGTMLWSPAVVAMAVVLTKSMIAGRMNPLLLAHILTVTAAYTAAFLIGGFGICWVYWRQFGRLSQVRQQSLSRGVLQFSQVAVGLLIIGVVFGLPVSKQIFGSYWQWDLKEIGALCAIVWLMALAVMTRFNRVSQHRLMLLCVGSNIVVSLAWFGAGMMDYNLKAHGYGRANMWPLVAFLCVQVCFLIAGLAPSPEVRES